MEVEAGCMGKITLEACDAGINGMWMVQPGGYPPPLIVGCCVESMAYRPIFRQNVHSREFMGRSFKTMELEETAL